MLSSDHMTLLHCSVAQFSYFITKPNFCSCIDLSDERLSEQQFRLAGMGLSVTVMLYMMNRNIL